MTNEYYANDDFEYDSSPERKQPASGYGTYSNTRNSMSRTVAPNRRRVTTAAVAGRRGPNSNNSNSKTSTSSGMPPKSASNNLIASKTFSSAQPRSNAATRQEYAQLIDYMQNAIIDDKNDRK